MSLYVYAAVTITAIGLAYLYFRKGNGKPTLKVDATGAKKLSVETAADKAQAAVASPVPLLHTPAIIVPTEYRKFPLIHRETLTNEKAQCPVVLFRFKLPYEDRSLELPVGQHISIKAMVPVVPPAGEQPAASESQQLEEIRRSYTPSSTNITKGHFDLIVKLYPQGRMSRFLDALQPNTPTGYIEVAGPKGLYNYKAGQHKHMIMIAGGSGITPMLQIMHHVLTSEDPLDKTTRVTLLNGNLSIHDIICHEMIREYERLYPDRFVCHHVLNNLPATEEDKQKVSALEHPERITGGFITKELIQSCIGELPEGSTKPIAMLCGPPPMIKAMQGHLSALGYVRGEFFTF